MIRSGEALPLRDLVDLRQLFRRHGPVDRLDVLFDLLDARGVTWRYYETHLGAGIWNAPNAIAHIRYGPDNAYLSAPASKTISQA